MRSPRPKPLPEPIREPPCAPEFVVCCAFCGRMRTPEGRWVVMSEEVYQRLLRAPGSVSHGYCKDCLRQHFPDYDRDHLSA
jgi:hypothetical protein